MSAEKPIDPLSQALDLGNRYGGISLIPPDELAALGYAHVAPGRIAPIGLTPDIRTDLEAKFDQRPFDTISIDLVTTGTTYRRVSGDELQRLNTAVNKITQLGQVQEGGIIAADRNEYCESIMGVLLPNQSPLYKLKDQLLAHIQRNYSEEDVRGIFTQIFIVSGFIPAITDHIDLAEVPEDIVNSFADSSTPQAGTILHPESTESLSTQLERVTAQIADLDEISPRFNKAHFDRESYIPVLEPEEDEADYTRDELIRVRFLEHGVENGFQLSAHFFGEMLEEYGLVGIADELRSAQSLEEAKDLLAKAAEDRDKKVFADLWREIARVKQALAGASLSERIELNERKSLLEAQHRNAKLLLTGMNHYYDLPTHTTTGVRRVMRNIQAGLVVHGDEGSTTLILDGRPDSELDRDPGVMSGDCTAGKPLPFAERSVPVFNIKVYQDRKHTGNIYLVEAVSGTRKTWHLDAIQVPSQKIVWNAAAIHALVSGLATEATEKGIKRITVNVGRGSVSNYDYIEEAVGEYVRENSISSSSIILPDNPDPEEYSNFQSPGIARVLWDNEQT